MSMNWSTKVLVTAGAAFALGGFLVFGLGSPATTIGQETDVEPPASGPNAATLGASADIVGAGATVDVTVNVLDDLGLPVEGASCTFAITSQPGSDASIDAGPVSTDAEGNATTTLNVGSSAGTIEVAADCDGATDTLSVAVDAGSTGTPDDTAAPPASLPDAGTGYTDATGSMTTVLVALLGGSGMALAAAGLLTGRLGRRQKDVV